MLLQKWLGVFSWILKNALHKDNDIRFLFPDLENGSNMVYTIGQILG